MKSCIIIPPSTFLDNDKVFVQLGPYYIKRFVEEHSNHTVDVLSTPPFLNLEDYDVIGFSVTTPQYNYVDSLLDEISKYSKQPITVLGGPHCRTYSVELNKFTYVIKEDGCKPFLDILDGKTPTNQEDDRDQLPYRDISFLEYKYELDGNRTTNAITSRGCYFSCRFCEDANSKVRLKSPEAVRKEVEECVSLGFTGIMFFDDLFCSSVSRVRSLCEVLKPLKIKFRCFAHAKSFTRKMAELLADAGCVEIGWGAEHVSQKILDIVDKRTKTSQNYELVKIAHEFGIRVKAFLMIGLPGEDHETVKELEQFVLTSGVDDFDICIYYPFVGTEIADNPGKYDIFIEPTSDGSAYYKGKLGTSTCTVRTSSLSSEEIKYWKDKIYLHHKRWKEKK